MDAMEKLEKLAKKLDEIDDKFKTEDRSDPLWNTRVQKKDHVVEKMHELFPMVPDSFPLSRYLLSSSSGHQVVAVMWIEFKKDPFHLNILCYMLLNASSNFLTYHILHVLSNIMNQCDSNQLYQLKQTLLSYSPPHGSRYTMKLKLLEEIEPQIDFSISDIDKDSYWWRDVESKFFNSLSGTSQFRLCGLRIIRNKKLFDNFNNYRDYLGENSQILFVYHGSSSKSLEGIAKNGFLEPHMLDNVANKISILDQGYFGRGIYQGFAADYAIHYAESYKKSNEILLSMVLPGRSYIVKKGGEKYGQVCESGFDSHLSPENKEIVLFQSKQILPLFIIRFERIPNANIVEEQC
ncbi:unnamed protein product [Adineta steineri]|uniref:PARP catalytic domain-containing protein n=1 Tax=Adineta steineri TaxID=433720 RepID=A0A818MVA6_9BILA|nr:unnamed protein product [Adineta steineri]CAF3595810.1 unnamed protein product [Adineta steineri]